MATEGKSGSETSTTNYDINKEEEEAADIFPAYALYRYNANRPKSSSLGNGDSADASVADFLQKEAVADRNFSLSMVTSNLDAEYEKELRLLMATKLGRGTLYSGSGNITSLQLDASDDEQKSALCFYCLLRQGHGLGPRPINGAISPNTDEAIPSYCSNEFVFCFLTHSDVTLDLYRPELDRYSQELIAMLDADPLLFFEDDEDAQVLELETIIKPHMEDWSNQVMKGLCRTVGRLQEDVKYLIHAALVDTKVNVVGQDEQLKKDISRFVDCCSMSELLSQLKTEMRSNVSTPLSDNSAVLVNTDLTNLVLDPAIHINVTKSPSKPTLILTLTEDSHSFDSKECTDFCDSWAQAMQNGDIENPDFLRQVIENYKLKAIQDMNTLKRLIRQAESDHYALYRSFVFLKASGNAAILLQHASLEHYSMTSQDAQDILDVLKSYVSETNNQER